MVLYESFVKGSSARKCQRNSGRKFTELLDLHGKTAIVMYIML
jgi:hypothetical protein